MSDPFDEDEVFAHDFSDDEFPDEDSWDDDASVEILPCPECGAEVYEEAEQCPACGAFILRDTSPLAGRAWWWIALGLIGTIAVVAALICGGL